MTDAITRDDMRELFERFFGGNGSAAASGGAAAAGPAAAKSIAEFTKHLKESTAAMKKSLPLSTQFEDVLRGQTKQFINLKDELEDIDNKLKEFGDTIENNEQLEQKQALEQARSEKIRQTNFNNSRIAVQNFSVTVGGVASTLIKGAFQFAKDLQSGASGVEAGTNAAASAAKGTGAAISSIGQIFVGLSAALTMLPGYFKILGLVAGALGVGLDILGTKSAEIAEEGINFLGTELKNTQKAYKDVTESGAVLAGGMTELRQTAATAGIDVSQLATVVRSSKDDLLGMGVGLGEATKRIAGVSKEIRNSELGIQLSKLGYSVEEQASLAASLMANQRAAGSLRVQSDVDVAKQTVAYGKDLKVLANITGEDAKKAAEKARVESMRADIMAKLGPAEAEKFQAQLRGMAPAFHKGFMEYVASGGTIVTDLATNILMSQQSEIGKAFEQGLGNIRDTSKTATDVQNEAMIARAKIGEAEQKRARSGEAVINLANTLGKGVPEAVSATAELTNQVMLQSLATEEATKNAIAAGTAATLNVAPLDVAVSTLENNTQKLKAALGEQLLTPITKFAETLSLGIETVEESMAKVTAGLDKANQSANIDAQSKDESFFRAPTKGELTTITSLIGGIGGTIASGAFTGGLAAPVGAIGGAAAGGAAGSALADWFKLKEGKAKGGIASGPLTGYIEKLHGTEAVVPLDDGRSIPVSMNFGDIIPNAIETILDKFLQNQQGSSVFANRPLNVSPLLTGVTALFDIVTAKINNNTNVSNSNDLANSIQSQPSNGRKELESIDFSSITNIVKDVFSNFKQEKSSSPMDNTTTLYSNKAVKPTADSELSNLIKEQLSILMEIRNTLDSSKDLQRQYVYNSYS